jgi:hypothetical protein
MRPSCRTSLAIRVAVFTIFIGFFSGAGAPVSGAQAASTLPKSWKDAVAKLGDEVAAAMSPAAVTLIMNNISSLDPSYVPAIGAALREQLQHHSFAFPAVNSTAAQSAASLRLTLSESVTEYVWVMGVSSDSADTNSVPMLMVSVSKSEFPEAEPGEQVLSLEKRFVWKQPEGFLDFALLKDPSSGQPLLLILETKRLEIYKSSGSGWQLWRSTPIPQMAALSRDSEGRISLKEGKIWFKEFECIGDPDLTGTVQCKILAPTHIVVDRTRIPGLPNSLGNLVYGECRGETISVYTGEGDWTQTDFLQGYLISLGPISAVAVGDAIQVRGPVISLQPEHDTSAARAIVHNLKTDEYEAYIVTATCSN